MQPEVQAGFQLLNLRFNQTVLAACWYIWRLMH